MPFDKLKRLFRVMPWLLALLLAGVFVLLLRYEWQRQDALWKETVDMGLEIQTLQVEITRWHIMSKALLAAEAIARNSQIVEVIRAGYITHLQDPTQSGPRISGLRAELNEQLQPYWQDLQRQKTRYVNVHFAPEAINFLRVHRPERYGDRLLTLRPLVMQVLSGGKAETGLEVGRHGVGYRAAVPVFASDDPLAPVIGVVEVGMGLLSARAHEAGSGKAVLLASSVLDNVLWDKARTDLILPQSRVEDRWLLESFSDPLAVAWYEAGVLPKASWHNEFKILSWKGRDYLLKAFPLKDYSNERHHHETATAVILSWRDISEEVTARDTTRWQTLLKWLFALLLAEVMMLALWRYMQAYIRALVDEHRIQLEAERDSSESAKQRLMLALSSSESGFWDWDLVKDKSIISREWRTICGISPDVLLQGDVEEWFSRVHPNDKPLFLADRLRHIKGETPIYENEHRLRAQDGSYKWIHTRGRVVEWQADGKAARMLGVYADISARKHNEFTILRQQAALRALNEIASLPAVEAEEQLRRALILGSRYLGMQTGIISRIEDETYAVKVQVSPQGQLSDGQTFALDQTYCSITLTDGDVFAMHHMGESTHAQHPGYKAFKQESYIGVPLWVEGDVYGTVSFCSASPRQRPYDAQDKDFMRLLARWMGAVIGHWLQDVRQQSLYERFRKLSQRLPGFLYQYQVNPDGKSFFPYASPGITSIYGVSPAQVSVSAGIIARVIHPDDLARFAESVAESAANLTTWRITYRVLHPQRGLMWVHGDAQPERLDDGSTLWHGFISDVTAAQDAAQQLQETTSLRQAIFDAAGVAIIGVDERGIVKTFNGGAEKMLGYLAEEVVGISTPALYHLPDEVNQRAQELAVKSGPAVTDIDVFFGIARREGTEEREWHFVHRDGHQFAVLLSVSALRNAAGKINGFISIARPVSELKRTDQLGHLVNDLINIEKLGATGAHFSMQPYWLTPVVQQAINENAVYAAQYQISFELGSTEVDVRVTVDATCLVQLLSYFLSSAASFSPPGSLIAVSISSPRERVRISVKNSTVAMSEERRARIAQILTANNALDSQQKSVSSGVVACKNIIERMGGSVGFDLLPEKGFFFYVDLPIHD